MKLAQACYALLFLLLLVVNCSDDSCVSTDLGDGPIVLETFPIDGAVDVATDTSFTVTFDKAMNPSYISSGSVTLEGPTGIINAAVTFDSLTTITITPHQFLVGHALHTIQLDASLRDTAGLAMGTPYAFSFTTGTTNLMLYPDVEYTIRDNNNDDTPDEILAGGPPGRFLQAGVEGQIIDRAIIEFPLDEVVYGEALNALALITLTSSTVHYGVARIESWGFVGNGSGELSDWDNGSRTLVLDSFEVSAGQTIAFPIIDMVNAALASGASHVGFRIEITGQPVVEIAASNGIHDEDKPRLLIQY